MDTILLDDGSGGKASQRLISELFVKYFSNPILDRLDDAALLSVSGTIAMSTDGYTVDPVEFPGGTIGSLAVHGTVNDVAMLGAKPLYLSCAFILEEGLDIALLERIVASMGAAAKEADVHIVTGDTKVVPRGAADKIFITTTGIGDIVTAVPPSGSNARHGDAILLSGSIGDHGLTIMSRQQGLSLATDLQSDSAALHRMTLALLEEVGDIHTLRDPTRGGLATTLNEIAEQSGVGMVIAETSLPVKPSVTAGCAVLGLDPLYLANEGKVICIVPAEKAEAALAVMRRFEEGREACLIGHVYTPDSKLPAMRSTIKSGQVLLETPIGGHRLLGMLEGEQLPRIC